jgi:hypothetical protein
MLIHIERRLDCEKSYVDCLLDNGRHWHWLIDKRHCECYMPVACVSLPQVVIPKGDYCDNLRGVRCQFFCGEYNLCYLHKDVNGQPSDLEFDADYCGYRKLYNCWIKPRVSVVYEE